MKFEMNIRKVFVGLIALSFAVMPVVGWAAGSGGAPLGGGSGGADLSPSGQTAPTNSNINFKLSNPFKGGNSLIDIINSILQYIVLPVGSVVVVLVIIFAGFKFLTAQGNPGEIKKAKDALLYALIGAAILLGAEGISKVVSGTICQLVTC